MRSALLVLYFWLYLFAPTHTYALSDNSAANSPSTYEMRQVAEKTSRSRYRVLEIASLVLILGAGGAAILWAIRRK